MEKIGEKHAFFEKRKCGSRKVLRFMRSLLYALTVLSLPLRGAWIEISSLWEKRMRSMSLPMWGVWIEIPAPSGDPGGTSCRSPHGERGLKYNVIQRIIGRTIVAPHAGSVVKIRGSCQATITGNVSGWQMVHLWCYSLSDCDWRKVCGSIFKKTR